MGTFPTLLLRLREAQDILGDAIATLVDNPSLGGHCSPMSRRLAQLILELQRLECSAREVESSAECQKSA
jgi:hypothetical protein